MHKKVLSFINREISGLHQAAYLLAGFSLLSQVLALVRDRLLAASFGASTSLDIYYAAFRIPDFIFITVGSMVSVSVLIPFLMSKMKDSPAEGKRFIGNVFVFFFSCIVVVCGIAFVYMRELNTLIFPGFSPDTLAEVVVLSRILLLSPILLGLSNIFGTLTQAYQRFFVYALSPILYNLSIIFGILVLYPQFGLVGLVYGVALGALLHAAIQVPFIVTHKLIPRISGRINFRELREVFIVSVPRTFTLGSDSISVMFLLSFASLMASGSIAIFQFSYNLQSVPLSMIGVSYSVAAFPLLIKFWNDKQHTAFIDQTILSAKHIIFWSIPISTLLVVLREPIVRVILGAGRFGLADMRLTAAALALFAFSVVFQNLTLLFVRAYYATGNTVKPFIAKFCNATSTIVFGYFFMTLFTTNPSFRDGLEWFLNVQHVPGTIILALPLGWSVGEILNTIILWLVFERDFSKFSLPVLTTTFQVIVASCGSALVASSILEITFNPLINTTLSQVFMQGFSAGIAGILSGVAILLLFKNEEFLHVCAGVHQRFAR